ncbi:MAG TPA: EamA family transporter [Baekduia sp.]|uniref:EamA family transporter n=1 Tax=Baekduia sp. TaxID=2600305 RepID=UPI002D788076|nr:EamA family transporter [Baekduia sp.]HET6509687.1 EamA family transporter [Baekduia sp.]
MTGPGGGPPGAAAAGLGLAVSAIVAIQLGNVLVIQVVPAVGALGAAGVRVLAGAAVLLAATRPAPRALDRADRLHVLRFGLLVAGTTICFMEAVARLPLAVALAVSFLGPLGVSLLGVRTARAAAWPLLGFAGVALVVGVTPAQVGQGSLGGYAFAVGNAILWAAYLVVAERSGARLPGRTGLALAVAVAAVLVAPVGFASAGAALLAPRHLLLAAAGGAITVGVAFGLEFEALRRLSARAYGTVVSLEPAVGTLFGALLLHQHVGARATAGVVLVVVASVAVSRSAARPSKTNER